MALKAKRARIQLTKHVIIEGKGHVDKGTKLEMDRYKASELVSNGQAKFIDEDEGEEDGRAMEEREQFGARIERPTHGDPGVENLDEQPDRPKVGKQRGK